MEDSSGLSDGFIELDTAAMLYVGDEYLSAHLSGVGFASREDESQIRITIDILNFSEYDSSQVPRPISENDFSIKSPNFLGLTQISADDLSYEALFPMTLSQDSTHVKVEFKTQIEVNKVLPALNRNIQTLFIGFVLQGEKSKAANLSY